MIIIPTTITVIAYSALTKCQAPFKVFVCIISFKCHSHLGKEAEWVPSCLYDAPRAGPELGKCTTDLET